MTAPSIPVDSADVREQRERDDAAPDLDRLHRLACRDGWLGEDDQGRPVPCPRCRGHLDQRRCRVCNVPRSRCRGGCCDTCAHAAPRDLATALAMTRPTEPDTDQTPRTSHMTPTPAGTPTRGRAGATRPDPADQLRTSLEREYARARRDMVQQHLQLLERIAARLVDAEARAALALAGFLDVEHALALLTERGGLLEVEVDTSGKVLGLSALAEHVEALAVAEPTLTRHTNRATDGLAS